MLKFAECNAGSGVDNPDRSVALEVVGTDLPASVLHKFPHLAGCTALKLPSAIADKASTSATEALCY